MAKGQVVKSCAVVFKDGQDPIVTLIGIWTRHDLEIAYGLLRRELPRHLAEARRKEAQDAG